MKRFLAIAIASVALAGTAGPAPAAPDPTLPDNFLAAAAGTSVDLFENFIQYQDSMVVPPNPGPAHASVGAPQVGSAAFIYGEAETDYGVNKALAQLSGQDPNLIVSGISYWTDSFTASGGGMATVSSTLTGTVGPLPFATAVYTVLATNDPTFFKDQDRLLGALETIASGDTPTDFTVVISHVATSFSSTPLVLTGTHPYTSGTFYMASLLGTIAFFSGSIDLTNTVNFGISSTTPLQFGSGTPYAAAVPEPGTWAMLAAGLLLLATVARRRVRRQIA
jgi:hypothetical protein